ncbi:hypothetical protein AB0E25_40905 [Streptomyces bobili]|uniref:hypothetical protein n=1 Tax=Streptomyces bobili TaxID=67280 RepID=UPI0033D0DE5A
MWARRGIEETPVFTAIEQQDENVHFPLLHILRTQPGAVVRTTGITVSGFVGGYLIQAFTLADATSALDIPKSTLLWAITLAATLRSPRSRCGAWCPTRSVGAGRSQWG